MKTTKLLFFLAAVIILSVTALIAQTKDVLHLKNGSVIKGSILEMIPDKTIKIQTADGNIFVYNMSEVEKISKEAAAPAAVPKPMIAPSTNEPQRSYESQQGYQYQRSSEGAGVAFSIFGGIALPVGDLAKKDGDKAGMAKLGWTAGAQLVTGGTIGFLIEGSYSQNKYDFPSDYTSIPGKLELTSYTTILGLAGLKIGTDNSSGTNFFIAPVAGVLNEKTPEVTFTPTGIGARTSTIDPSASGTAFAYGGIVEVIVGGHVTLNGKYIASKPKFKYTYTSPYNNQSSEVETDPYNWSMVIITLGIAF